MSKAIAENIKTTANNLGWTVRVNGSILIITKAINKNDNNDFCKADAEYYSILGLLPTTSAGSIWGTDGGGIGAISAMQNGLFKMNKSGGSKRVLNALAKIL